MLVYPLANTNETLIFSDQVLKVLSENVQNTPQKPEAGGQLFANIGEKTVNIVAATLPTAKDFQSRFAFVRDQALEQQAIFDHKLRGLDYVGDWHTHPERIPYPSGVDKRTTAKLFRKSKHDLKGFLLVIIGTEPMPEGLYVGIKTRWKLTHLQAKRPLQLV